MPIKVCLHHILHRPFPHTNTMLIHSHSRGPGRLLGMKIECMPDHWPHNALSSCSLALPPVLQ